MNTYLYFHFTPVGRNVTIENAANGDSATLKADGRVERSICDQVILEGRKVADFQDSLDTISIRGLLNRLRQQDVDSLKDRHYMSEITKEALGQGWSGRAHPTSDGTLNASFQTGAQRLRIYGPADNKHLDLLTMHDDSEKRSWAHHMSARLDDNYQIIRDTVQEHAKVKFHS